MQLKAIETKYKGYNFRSRAEARIAVFLDALGVVWAYEKEAYDLGIIGGYLPDFDLGEWGFLEVKGEQPTPFEMLKAATLAQVSGRRVIIFHDEGAWVFSSTDFCYEVGPVGGGLLLCNKNMNDVDAAFELAKQARFDEHAQRSAPTASNAGAFDIAVASGYPGDPSDSPAKKQRWFNEQAKAGADAK